MLGVRSMEYRASKNGIENRSKMNDFNSDKIIQLVERNEDVPDRMRRKDFAKAKSCIPEVTRFEIGEGADAIVYVYDENSDCMVREDVPTV